MFIRSLSCLPYESRNIGYCHVLHFFSVLSGIKQVNVELEPGFQTVAQRRNSGRYIEQHNHIKCQANVIIPDRTRGNFLQSDTIY